MSQESDEEMTGADQFANHAAPDSGTAASTAKISRPGAKARNRAPTSMLAILVRATIARCLKDDQFRCRMTYYNNHRQASKLIA